MPPVTGRTATSSDAAGRDGFRLEAVSAWILGFGMILLLGLQDGGFEASLFGQAGIFVWLILLLGTVLGLMPVARPGRSAWAGLGLLAALATWGALGLLWTESVDKSWVEVARLSTYTAFFALAVSARGGRALPHQIGSMATAVAVIAALALLSRFFPDLFPAARRTGEILTSESSRLAFPIDYWNGLGALLALGIPLLLQVAAGAKRLSVRLPATGALPLLFLALYLTFSRGSLLAAAASLVVFHLLVRRPGTLAISAVGLGGGIALIALASVHPALREGLVTPAAHSEGIRMLWLTLLVCGLTALAGWGVIRGLKRVRLPAWPRPRRRTAAIGFGAGLAALIALLLLFGAPERVADSWQEFKSNDSPATGSVRLGATSGNGRYQLWSSGLRQFGSEPVTGRGAGTFEYWWAERGDRPGFVRDAHSLYIQTLGEYGLVGFLLLAGFLILVLAAGMMRSWTGGRHSPWTAAATAASFAFAISAALDWTWQLPAVTGAFVLLAATVLARPDGPEAGPAAPGPRQRAVLAGLAVAGVALLAVPVASVLLLNRSSSEVRAGQLAAALDSARAAARVSPATAAPRIQQAGIFELQGNHPAARSAARKATALEPVNWRNWYTLSRIETAAGNADAASLAMRQARILNPRSALFRP